jgi:hypothetical protein
MRWTIVVASALGAACSSSGDATEAKPAGSATSTTPKGSAGGFSASLSAELAKEGGTPAAVGSGTGSSNGAAIGSADARGSGGGSGIGSGSGSGKAGSAAPAAKPPDVVAKVVDAGMVDAAVKVVEHKDPVKLTPELAAIKFELLPNWVRDDVGAATFSFVLNVPKSNERKTFAFHYGYDLPNAPSDRDQYKKLLADQKLLVVTTDRQRGAAWYLEGTDAGGGKAFRFVVTYGGKRLVCYGSAFHDAEHDPLGDLRDEVVVQAKKICESLSL